MGEHWERRQIRAARTALEEEYRRTESEAAAFNDFSDRVAALRTAQVRPDGGTVRCRTVRGSYPNNGTPRGERVCRIYRDTIRSIPRYSNDDEPLPEHMAAEFGPDLVESVFANQRLTPALGQALVTAGRDARTCRTRFLEKLDAESNALETADASLRNVARRLGSWDARPLSEYSFEELVETHERLDKLEEHCERIATERQRALLDGEWSCPNPSTSSGLQAYLYRDLSVTYPVLADVAAQCRLLRRAQSRVRRMLTTVE